MVMVESKSKKSTNFILIKAPRFMTTTKNQNLPQAMIMNKPFNNRRFNKRLTKKNDKSLNKSNLNRL